MAHNLGFGVPLIGANAPALTGQAPRRSWQSRLFDRLVPQSSSGLIGIEDEDKKALVRQGLLQLAAGIQSSPSLGQGITQGLLGGSQALSQGLEDVQTRRLREQQLQQLQANALPTEFRARDLAAKAAGYQPGTKGYQDYFKRAGGELARAVTGARKNVEIVGADGLKRPGVFDPSSPYGYSVYDETTGGFRPLDVGEAPTQESIQAAAPTFQPQAWVAPQPTAFAGAGPTATQVNIEGVPQEQQQRLAAGAAALRSAGYDDAAIDAFVQQQLSQPRTATPPMPRAPAPARLAVGRSPEAQAALTTAAEEEAKLAVLPRRLEAEATGAGLKTTAEATAKVAAERVAKEQQKAIDATERADLLNQAEILLPQATSGGAQRRGAEAAAFFGASTPGAQATAGLNTIAARLVAKVPRFEGPQSDKDVQSYKDAAGNLADPNLPVQTRLAALRTMRSMDAKYEARAVLAKPKTQQGWGIQRVP